MTTLQNDAALDVLRAPAKQRLDLAERLRVQEPALSSESSRSWIESKYSPMKRQADHEETDQQIGSAINT